MRKTLWLLVLLLPFLAPLLGEGSPFGGAIIALWLGSLIGAANLQLKKWNGEDDR